MHHLLNNAMYDWILERKKYIPLYPLKEYVQNIFMSFDNYLFLEVKNILI